MSLRTVEAGVGAGIAFLSLGVWLWGIPAWVEASDFALIPPDLLPRICVAVIGGLAALMTLHRLLLVQGDEPSGMDPARLGRVALLIAGFAAGVALMLTAGYLVGGVLLVAGLMLFMGARDPRTLLGVSAGAPLALYGLFDLALGVPLP